jgi:hypothetical protein
MRTRRFEGHSTADMMHSAEGRFAAWSGRFETYGERTAAG